jgi:hypothetical protein
MRRDRRRGGAARGGAAAGRARRGRCGAVWCAGGARALHPGPLAPAQQPRPRRVGGAVRWVPQWPRHAGGCHAATRRAFAESKAGPAAGTAGHASSWCDGRPGPGPRRSTTVQQHATPAEEGVGSGRRRGGAPGPPRLTPLGMTARVAARPPHAPRPGCTPRPAAGRATSTEVPPAHPSRPAAARGGARGKGPRRLTRTGAAAVCGVPPAHPPASRPPRLVQNDPTSLARTFQAAYTRQARAFAQTPRPGLAMASSSKALALCALLVLALAVAVQGEITRAPAARGAPGAAA